VLHLYLQQVMFIQFGAFIPVSYRDWVGGGFGAILVAGREVVTYCEKILKTLPSLF
jgi:hypothetical protein